MALQPSTVKEILDKAAYQYKQILTGVEIINTYDPDYFPLFSVDNDYSFERVMIPQVYKTDNWNVESLIKASPLAYLIPALNSYFATNIDMSDAGYGGALDAYLYDNDLTAYKYYADAQYIVNNYKMAGILVDNTSSFIFAEFGIDNYDAYYFDSLGSYQTDDITRPYGDYDTYTSYAPTDQVEIEIISGTGINFDIHLICKDKNGEAFIFVQSITGSTGDKVKLGLSEKITGCVGLETNYSGMSGDKFRIQTIEPEV
jgi:hypothetical protein